MEAGMAAYVLSTLQSHNAVFGKETKVESPCQEKRPSHPQHGKLSK